MQKPYSPPALKELTYEQAKQFVADRKHCSLEQAAEFLNSLRRPQQQRKEQAPDEEWKRSA
jgi:hypothetical protein